MFPSQFVNMFISDALQQEDVGANYARNLVSTCIISFFTSVAFSGIYYLLNDHESASMIIVFECVALLPLILVRFSCHLLLAKWIFIISLDSLLCYLTYRTGGEVSTTAYWFVVPPIIGALIGGVGFSLFFTFVSLLLASIFFYLNWTNYVFPPSLISDIKLLTCFGVMGLIIVCVALVLFYEMFLAASLRKIRDDAYVDSLTGLYNRLFYKKTLDRLLTGEEGKKGWLSIIAIDIDNFNKVNIIFGKEYGDILLEHIAHRIENIMPTSALITRLVSDEFKIILTGNIDIEEVNAIANAALTILSQPYQISSSSISVTVSIGIATSYYKTISSHFIDRFVDISLKKAKQTGGNKCQYFNTRLEAEYEMQAKIEKHLGSAITNHEFTLHFQPIIDVHDGDKIVAFEALLRWHNDEIGQVPAELFIPVAEKMDLISGIDEWVLQEACKIHRKWQQMRLIDDAIPFSVNLSAKQLYDENFSATFLATLHENGCMHSNIIAELTETAIIADIKHAAEVLKELHQVGIGIAIDDFGSGQTSLTYLSELPIQKLKIDKSFIDHLLPEGSKHGLIVQAIIDMAHYLKIVTIAEGVETLDQVNALKKMKCDYIQGFYFSRPLDVATMEKFLGEYPNKVKFSSLKK